MAPSLRAKRLVADGQQIALTRTGVYAACTSTGNSKPGRGQGRRTGRALPTRFLWRLLAGPTAARCRDLEHRCEGKGLPLAADTLPGRHQRSPCGPVRGADQRHHLLTVADHRGGRAECRTQPAGLRGYPSAPVGHCENTSVAARGSLVYAYARCAKNAYDDLDLAGPVRFVRLDSTTLNSSASWPLGTCGDGSSLAVTHQGDVLLNRYHYCVHAVHDRSQPRKASCNCCTPGRCARSPPQRRLALLRRTFRLVAASQSAPARQTPLVEPRT
ncbi:MAG: hypothetical protein QOJ11_1428 [Frankiales bacterium]|nr:hypothetical protein [Frankiales bacterium]